MLSRIFDGGGCSSYSPSIREPPNPTGTVRRPGSETDSLLSADNGEWARAESLTQCSLHDVHPASDSVRHVTARLGGSDGSSACPRLFDSRTMPFSIIAQYHSGTAKPVYIYTRFEPIRAKTARHFTQLSSAQLNIALAQLNAVQACLPTSQRASKPASLQACKPQAPPHPNPPKKPTIDKKMAPVILASTKALHASTRPSSIQRPYGQNTYKMHTKQ